ncbi:MAG: hypothetical protein WAU42_01345 [Solirubrobacteraceae bacterium]
MSKFIIPTELVRTLRMGLHGELGDAASDIQHTTEEPMRTEYPEQYEEPLARFDGARTLLDEVGWGEPPQPTSVEIDLTQHKCPLLRALRTQALVHRDMLEEAKLVDMERAKLGKPPKAQTTIARAGALSELLAGLALALVDAEDEEGSSAHDAAMSNG